MFWSDDNINNFVYKKLADGDNMYNVLFKYNHSLEKADAIRYFILYEFGGIYLDFDVEFFNSILPYLNRGYPCMMTRDPPEQAYLFGNMETVVSNALMMCLPGHPFMRLVIDSLPDFMKLKLNVVFTTGPFFLTEIYNRYRTKMASIDKEIANICARDASLHPNCVHVEDESVFEDNQYLHLQKIKRMCLGDISTKPASIQKRCRDMIARLKTYGSMVRRGVPPQRLGIHHHLNLGHVNGGLAASASDFDFRLGIEGYWEVNKENKMHYIKV